MYRKLFSFFCLLVFLFPAGLLAAPPVGGYQPGATLNPDCTPGSANCTVVPLASSGANLNITSLGGLTTPLSFSQGGIGLSTLGAGELLYSSTANSLSPLALNSDFLINSGTLNINDSGLSVSASQISDFSTAADNRITLQKALANGLATLDANGKVPTDQLNPIELNNTFVVASSSDITALAAAVGDIAVVTSENKTYVLKELPASNLANWIELLTPASVLSVNSYTGAVTLTTSDITEGSNLYFTNERSDDRVGALINDGIGIYKTYDDINNTLTLNINESLLNVNNLGGFPLAAAKGGTGLSSISVGEIIYGSGTNIFSVLGAGSSGQVLKISGGLPVWDTDNDTTYSAGAGLSLLSSTFSVNQSDLSLDNFAGVLGISKGGTGATSSVIAFNSLAPTQTGQSGKFLTTNGSVVSWAAVPGGITDHTLLTNIGTNTHAQLDSHLINYSNPHQVTADQVVPTQTSQSGKFLTTNGSVVSWAAVPGGITDHTLLTNIGTNTHAQLDAHLINYSNPHQVTVSQLGANNLITALNTATSTIDWAIISKSGSSLADLVTRNYSDLSGRPGDDDFHSLSSESIVDAADEILLYSQSNSNYRKMTRANFIAGLGAGGSTAWSDLTTPTANLSLSLGNYKTSFNFGSATGVNNMFSLSDTLNNNGTGYLLSAITASGSSLKPLAIGVNGQAVFTISQTGTSAFGDMTNNLKIGPNGAIRLYGSAMPWDDLRVPLEATKSGGANDPSFVQIATNGAGSRGVYAYSFPANTADRELFFSVQLPHSWYAGSMIEPHVHWAPSDATAGNAAWGLECVWTNANDTIGATSIMVATSTAAGAKKHTMAGFPGLDGTGKNVSSMLSCRVFRDSNNAIDTYNSAAYLLEIDFHYQIDSLGSDNEISKTY